MKRKEGDRYKGRKKRKVARDNILIKIVSEMQNLKARGQLVDRLIEVISES